MFWIALKRAFKYWLIACLIVACVVGYMYGICMITIHFGLLGIAFVLPFTMLIVFTYYNYEVEKAKVGK